MARPGHNEGDGPGCRYDALFFASRADPGYPM